MIKKISRKLILIIPEGLGITNATLLATTVNRSLSTVTMEFKNITCSGSDIGGLLRMNIKSGDYVTITAQGEDSEDLLRRIDVLFRNNIENAFVRVHNQGCQKAIA